MKPVEVLCARQQKFLDAITMQQVVHGDMAALDENGIVAVFPMPRCVLSFTSEIAPCGVTHEASSLRLSAPCHAGRPS